MILEIATLNIIEGKSAEFEEAFSAAQKIIMSMKGYISHDLQKCLENDNKYILMVNWETLEDHINGFRQSPDYQEWKKLLHHFYDPFPTVQHYQKI
ncbi:antibiotic biosynthesis monooxygenase [Rickettsiales bacterium]|nr:antibiotic biosynthesis monooxygenase [Rickettsiales bacterium]